MRRFPWQRRRGLIRYTATCYFRSTKLSFFVSSANKKQAVTCTQGITHRSIPETHAGDLMSVHIDLLLVIDF
jgi:hypothetical protein